MNSPLSGLTEQGPPQRVWGKQEPQIDRPLSPHDYVPELQETPFHEPKYRKVKRASAQLLKEFEDSGPATDKALTDVSEELKAKIGTLEMRLEASDERAKRLEKSLYAVLGAVQQILGKQIEVANDLAMIKSQESPEMKAFRSKLVVSEKGVSEKLVKVRRDIEESKLKFLELKTRARFIRKSVEHISKLYVPSETEDSPISLLKQIPEKEIEAICRSSKETLRKLEMLNENWSQEIPKEHVKEFQTLTEFHFNQLRTAYCQAKDYKSLNTIENTLKGTDLDQGVDYSIFSRISEKFYYFVGGAENEKVLLLSQLFEDKERWKAIQLDGKLNQIANAAIREKKKAFYGYVKDQFDSAEKAKKSQKEPDFDLHTFLKVLGLFDPQLGQTALTELSKTLKEQLLKPLESEAKELLTLWKGQKEEAERLFRDEVQPRIEKGVKMAVPDETFERMDEARHEDLLVSEGAKTGVCVEVLSEKKNSSKNQFARYSERTEACRQYKEDVEMLIASVQDPKDYGVRYDAGKMLYELSTYLERGCSSQGLISWVWNARSKPNNILQYLDGLIDVTVQTSKAVTVNKQKRDDSEASEEESITGVSDVGTISESGGQSGSTHGGGDGGVPEESDTEKLKNTTDE